MKYWDFVLLEVLNKNDQEYPKRFTNIACDDRAKIESIKRKARKLNSGPRKVDKVYSDWVNGCVFSQREIECLSCFSYGLTISQTAECLSLVDRTIEYHSHNLCKKFDCKNKHELVDFISKEKKLLLRLLGFYQDKVCKIDL